MRKLKYAVIDVCQRVVVRCYNKRDANRVASMHRATSDMFLEIGTNVGTATLLEANRYIAEGFRVQTFLKVN